MKVHWYAVECSSTKHTIHLNLHHILCHPFHPVASSPSKPRSSLSYIQGTFLSRFVMHWNSIRSVSADNSDRIDFADNPATQFVTKTPSTSRAKMPGARRRQTWKRPRIRKLHRVSMPNWEKGGGKVKVKSRLSSRLSMIALREVKLPRGRNLTIPRDAIAHTSQEQFEED